MSKREEIIRTYKCTDSYGESCAMDCEECEKEIAKMLDDFEKEIRVDERNKCIRETKAFVDKHSLEVGMKKGAKEFTEWLQENVFITDGITSVKDVIYTRVVSFTELLNMYEEEQKND